MEKDRQRKVGIREEVYGELKFIGVDKTDFKEIPPETLEKVSSYFDELPFGIEVLLKKYEDLRGNPRLKGHIQRLCDTSRTLEENIFGLLVLFIGDRQMPKVALREYSSTTWWWSVSPYILKILIEAGCSIDESYRAICYWGQSAKKRNDKIEGLEQEMGYFEPQQWVLSPDPKSPSHEYAKILAKEVISKIEVFSSLVSRKD